MSKVRTFNVCVHDEQTRVSSSACAAVTCDLVKYVLYQKLQVPYSYDLLKRAVHGRRDRGDIRESNLSSRQYRIASSAFESLENIFKALSTEIMSDSPPQEICLVLGATLGTCREVYRLILPERHHKTSCIMDHSTAGHQLRIALLKTLTTSEVFDEMILKPLAPTNLHVLICKSIRHDVLPSINHQHFTPSRGCRVPTTARLAVIRLPGNSKHNLTCCNGFDVYEDFSDCEQQTKTEEVTEVLEDVCLMETTERHQWYEASAVVKGFKDCCINGSSIVNEWLNQN